MKEDAKVRIGFVPTYRFAYSDWCRKMHAEGLDALRSVAELDLVEIPAPTVTEHGCVHTLDEADAAADHLAAQKVDGIVICPLDFGDERSVATVAQRLGVPVMLYATIEPPARTDASLARVSDSYCGKTNESSSDARSCSPLSLSVLAASTNGGAWSGALSHSASHCSSRSP